MFSFHQGTHSEKSSLLWLYISKYIRVLTFQNFTNTNPLKTQEAFFFFTVEMTFANGVACGRLTQSIPVPLSARGRDAGAPRDGGLAVCLSHVKVKVPVCADVQGPELVVA